MAKKEPEKVYASRKVVFSGYPPSARVTLPPEVVKVLELKEEKKDDVLFVVNGNLVIIGNLRRISEKALDEHTRLTLQLLRKRWEIARQLLDEQEKYYLGKIERIEFDKTKEQKREELKKLNQIFSQVSSSASQFLGERELHFASAIQLDQLLTFVSIEEESEKQENFLTILEYVTQMKEEEMNLKRLLEILEERKNQGKMNWADYNEAREKYLGRLELAEERLKKLKNILCV